MARRIGIVAAIVLGALMLPQAVIAAVGSFSSASSTPAVNATNSTTGKAVNATSKGATGYFVSNATSGAYTAVYGQQSSPTAGANGLYGYATNSNTSAATNGVSGRSNSRGGRGVYGFAPATSGVNYGVLGQSNSGVGRGVYGLAAATGGTQNFGVYGQSNASGFNASGVFGYAANAAGFTNGVYGKSISPVGTGVYGEAMGSDGWGVFGSGALGVYGSGDGIGVYGDSPAIADGSYGVLSATDLGVSGHLVGGGSNLAGSCTIAASAAESPTCTFQTPFPGSLAAPVVVVTPLGDPGGYFWISTSTQDLSGNWNGFKISRSATPGTAATFNWIVVGTNSDIAPAAPARAQRAARAARQARFER